MKEYDVLHRYYKLSINIGPLHYYSNTKVFEIKQGSSTILPGLQYSLVSLLLGW